MRRILVSICACTVLLSLVTGGPTDKRGPKDLSEEEHWNGEEHNADYDHEAFLGKEEADEFDNLPPEEAKRRLGIIAGRIDIDGDNFVSHEELVNWIRHVGQTYIYDNVDNQLPIHDGNRDGKLTLEEYFENAFGEVEDKDDIYDTHRNLTYEQMKNRERKRFLLADEDHDGFLSREEFAAFLHPEEIPRMRVIVIDETMEDMDKDQDGFVTLEEYINDIWPKWERKEGEPEPEWVESEREQFAEGRDMDGDGKLNRDEIAKWISPEDFDPAKSEADHLMYNADKNKDKKLTKEEILDNMKFFVGSQATDYGNYLTRHDEF